MTASATLTRQKALGGPAIRAFALPVRFTWEGVNRAVNGAQGLTTMVEQ